jgi:hypothetical protein
VIPQGDPRLVDFRGAQVDLEGLSRQMIEVRNRFNDLGMAFKASLPALGPTRRPPGPAATPARSSRTTGRPCSRPGR